MFLDILIIILLFLGAGYGLVRGAIKQIFSILGIIIGIGLAVLFTKKIAILIGYGDETLALVIIFLAIFVISFVGTMLIGRLIRKIMHLMLMGMLDRFFGMIIGIVKGLFAAWVLTLLILYIKPPWFLSSKLGPVVLDIAKFFIGEIFKQKGM